MLRKKIDKNRYLVSAIVSTYNAERFIHGCLENLENQTIAEQLEIIVVNSGSQQNEEAVVREFQENYDNIRYIKTERRETIYAAWNKAIKIASGKYITNANTDDRRRKDSLERMVKELEKNPNKALVYTNQALATEIDGKRVIVGETTNGYFSRFRLLLRNTALGSQPLWRKELHDEFGYFDESFFCCGDDEFWLRVSQKYSFLYLNEILGEHLVRPDSVQQMSERSGIHLLESEIIHQAYLYALEKSILIDHKGISQNPIFSNWYQVNLWKQKVNNIITGQKTELSNYVKAISDVRIGESPKLSVVIVTYNRPKDLQENLKALTGQSEDKFEVIIVDNGKTLSEPAKTANELKQGVCYIELKYNLGPSFARNIAVLHARAEYVAFLDDDATPHEDFVKNIVRHFQDYNICGLRGRIITKTQEGYKPIPYDLGNEICPAACDTVGNSAFRTDIFLRVGGFDNDLYGYEGSELSYRIYKSRDKDIECILYFPDVIVYHDYYKNSEDTLEENVRRNAMERLIAGKEARAIQYLQFMDNFYPHKGGDNKYKRLLAWSTAYEKKDQEKALKYAKEAIELNPVKYEGYYILGSLYLRFNKILQAQDMFGKTLMLLEKMVGTESIVRMDNYSDLSAVYVSCCTKLASCYASQGNYEKAVEVSTKLINSKHFEVSSEHIANIRKWLAKYQAIKGKELLGNGIRQAH